MSTPDDRTGVTGEPHPPPRSDPARPDPPQPPVWESPASAPQGWGPPPGYPPQGYVQSGAPATTDAKAIVALVFAIGSFVVMPFVPAVVALVLASSSRREIEGSGGRLGGAGLVTAARVVAWVNIGLCVAGVLLFLLVFGALFSTGFS